MYYTYYIDIHTVLCEMFYAFRQYFHKQSIYDSL